MLGSAYFCGRWNTLEVFHNLEYTENRRFVTLSQYRACLYSRSAFDALAVDVPREMKGIGDEMKGIGDEFDQMDAEEREEATSGTSHTVSWRKARAYLGAIVAARYAVALPVRV